MTFYPDKGQGDDLEIENKYSMDLEKDSDDSDSFLVKSNKKKKDLVSGIDHQELKERIENFSLDDEDREITNEIITEDEEGVPSIKDSAPVFKEKNIKKKDKAEREHVFLKNTILKSVNSLKNNKKFKTQGSLAWYMKISRLPIFLIVSYSVLLLFREYLITISSSLTNIAQNMSWFDSMKWPFEILVFLFTTYFIIKKKKQLPRIAGIAGVIIGFSAGVIIAVIKLFWYREMWNIFYLSSESIFLGLTGLVVTLLASALFYEEYK
jgi:hypothetical protein